MALQGIAVLGNALRNIGRLKGAAPAIGRTWGNLTHGLRPVANNTVTSIVKAAPVVQAAPKMTRGVLHPLSLLSSGVQASALAGGVSMLGGLGDWTSAQSVGRDKVNDLDEKGVQFGGLGAGDDLNALDRVRLGAGQLIRGNFGQVFSPSEGLQQTVLDSAQEVRNQQFDNVWGGQIDANKRALGGLTSLMSRDDYTGKSKADLQRENATEQERIGKVNQLLGIEGGIEKLAELQGTIGAAGLQGAATQLNTANRDKAERKIQTERERQEGRQDAAAALERERQDNNTKLQLLLGDRADKRAEAKERRLREDKQYYDMLDRKERRAQRQDARIRSERQAQQEMISMLLGGLNNF